MKNFHIKSILLGIGIGIVLTSIISMIYLAGTSPKGKMSTEEIKAEAKKLGMVEKSAFVNDSEKSSSGANNTEQKKDEQKKPLPGEGASKNDKPVQAAKQEQQNIKPQEKPEAKEVKISVNPGDSSEKVAEKLQSAGLISDRTAFVNELTSMGLSSEINVGEFVINTGMDMKSIIKILTSTR